MKLKFIDVLIILAGIYILQGIVEFVYFIATGGLK